MNKNIKNALLLGTVVALTGSSWAGDFPVDAPDFSDFPQLGGKTVEYKKKADGKLERTDSGIQRFKANKFNDDDELTQGKNQYKEHMGVAIDKYKQVIDAAKIRKAKLQETMPKESDYQPEPVDESELMVDGKLWEYDAVTEGSTQVDDTGRTVSHLRRIYKRIEADKKKAVAEAKKKFEEAKRRYTEDDRNLGQVIQLEQQKYDEKLGFIKDAESATLETPWQTFGKGLGQDDLNLFTRLGDGSPAQVFGVVKEMYAQMEQLEQRTKRSEQNLVDLQKEQETLRKTADRQKRNAQACSDARNLIVEALFKFEPLKNAEKNAEISKGETPDIVNFLNQQVPEWNKVVKAKGGNGQVPGQPEDNPAAGGPAAPAQDAAPAPLEIADGTPNPDNPQEVWSRRKGKYVS